MHCSKGILIAIILGIAFMANAQDKAYDDLFQQVKKYGQVEVTFRYPGFNKLTDIGKLISISGVKDGLAYCMLSEKDLDVFLSLNLNYKIIPGEESKAVQSALSVEEAMNWDSYPTYPQYDTIIHKLAADYPFICRVDTIGESLDGRLILALKISDNVHEDEDEPEVFYSSNIHGDELAGLVLMLRLSEYLLSNAGNGGLEQALVDSLEIWINPLSNPDGTYHGGDTITFPIRANANGTDLNRNFPDPFNPDNIPEPENEAMISFMRARDFVISANFHSGYEIVNFPWDRWLSKIPADSVWFYQIGRRYADTVHFYSEPSYMNNYSNGVVRGSVWYVIYGGRQDYVTYELQGREVTIEVDNTKQTPAAQLPLLWDYNHRSFLRYLGNAFFGIHGKVIDNETGQPVEAKIYIPWYDKDSSHIYSDPLIGSFARMLSPGTWDLIISANGYQTERVRDIVLDEMEQKYITVKLMGAATVENTGENYINIWPVPAGDHLFLNAEKFIGNSISIRISNMTGVPVLNIGDVFVDEDQLAIDISHLSPGYYILTLVSSNGRNYNKSFIRH